MTAHINVLVDSRTFKYCFNIITRPGNNLDTMTIDHFTMYMVYKVFYVYYFKAVLYDWRKLIIKY